MEHRLENNYSERIKRMLVDVARTVVCATSWYSLQITLNWVDLVEEIAQEAKGKLIDCVRIDELLKITIFWLDRFVHRTIDIPESVVDSRYRRWNRWIIVCSDYVKRELGKSFNFKKDVVSIDEFLAWASSEEGIQCYFHWYSSKKQWDSYFHVIHTTSFPSLLSGLVYSFLDFGYLPRKCRNCGGLFFPKYLNEQYCSRSIPGTDGFCSTSTMRNASVEKNKKLNNRYQAIIKRSNRVNNLIKKKFYSELATQIKADGNRYIDDRNIDNGLFDKWLDSYKDCPKHADGQDVFPYNYIEVGNKKVVSIQLENLRKKENKPLEFSAGDTFGV